jgi:hypothetical protein
MSINPRTVVLALTVAVSPGLLAAQTLPGRHTAASARNTGAAKLTLEGTAGLTTQGGYVQSASLGFSPSPWVTLLVQGERFHVPTRHRTFSNGSSTTRGFTSLLLGGEVRVGLPTSGRVSGYAALGVGGGAWGSNVDQHFSERDSGPVYAGNVGGGVRIRVRPNLSVVADARLALALAGDSLLAYVPIRGGLAWDF